MSHPACRGRSRLVAERLNAGDAAGVAALYEPDAVLAYPADRARRQRDGSWLRIIDRPEVRQP